MSISVDSPIKDYSSIDASAVTSLDSFLNPSPPTVIEATKHPLSLKEAKALRQDSIKVCNLFEKALTEYSSLTTPWKLASNIKERPTLEKAYDLQTIHKRKQLDEALTDPKIKPLNHNRAFLALNVDEVDKKGKSELKAELFCLREDVLPRQVAIDKLCDFIKYPYSQNPEKLPYKTRSVALDILSKNQKDPFREKEELGFLGEGFYGQVHKIAVEGEPYAVKTLRKENPVGFNREYENLLFLDHPNIVKLLHADDANLYMEYIEGTTFQDGDFDLRQTLNILIQIADALTYLHDLGYIHGDLHSNNILITKDCTAKLIDFGNLSSDDCDDVFIDVANFLSIITQFSKKNPLFKKLLEKFNDDQKAYIINDIKKDLKKILRSLK